MALTRFVAALAAIAFLLPGCLNLHGGGPSDSVLAQVNDTLGSLQTSEFRLVSVTLTDSYQHLEAGMGAPVARDILQRHHTYLYVDPVNARYRQVEVWHSIEGATHTYGDQKETSGTMLSGLGVALPPLPAPFSSPTVAAVEGMVAAMSSLVTQPQPGNAGGQVSYWLSAIGGNPVWTVSSSTTNGLTRAYYDATTLAPIAMGPKATPPGSVAINRPDLNLTEARFWSDLVAAAWAPDAFIYDAGTQEHFGAPVFEFAHGVEHVPRILLLPDLATADGLAPVWSFIYYSPARQMVKPIAVYATLLAVAGNEEPTEDHPDPATGYVPVDYDRLVASDAAAAHIPASVRGPFLTMGVDSSGPQWRFAFPDYIEVGVDGYTGALEICMERRSTPAWQPC